MRTAHAHFEKRLNDAIAKGEWTPPPSRDELSA